MRHHEAIIRIAGASIGPRSHPANQQRRSTSVRAHTGPASRSCASWPALTLACAPPGPSIRNRDRP
jgi:hypothetical protein